MKEESRWMVFQKSGQNKDEKVREYTLKISLMKKPIKDDKKKMQNMGSLVIKNRLKQRHNHRESNFFKDSRMKGGKMHVKKR